jgi:hypothetical protein
MKSEKSAVSETSVRISLLGVPVDPNNCHFSPVDRIISTCSIGWKSVGEV